MAYRPTVTNYEGPKVKARVHYDDGTTQDFAARFHGRLNFSLDYNGRSCWYHCNEYIWMQVAPKIRGFPLEFGNDKLVTRQTKQTEPTIGDASTTVQNQHGGALGTTQTLELSRRSRTLQSCFLDTL